MTGVFMFTRWKIKKIIRKLKAMQANRVNNQPGDEVLKKEISYYFELAEIYKKIGFNKKHPYAHFMYQECLRAAAGLDDAQANYQLGKIVLDEAKFRENLEKDGIFKSEANNKKCQQLYEEAHAYLSAAMGLGHIEAKRLRGLSIINGWGVEADKKAGFELVVASIEQEGAWDRVPQIFASMGLNKPEFFSEIMQRRKSS
jgi:TPR repeat protein